MILVDTNVLIDYFRGSDPDFNKKFDSLQIGICGIVKTELLHGARTDDEADNMIKTFTSFELITIDEYRKKERAQCIAAHRRVPATMSFVK